MAVGGCRELQSMIEDYETLRTMDSYKNLQNIIKA